MSWNPGQPLLRKINGKWKQDVAMADPQLPTHRDVQKLDAWMRDQQLARSRTQWNKHTTKKKGGETV